MLAHRCATLDLLDRLSQADSALKDVRLVLLFAPKDKEGDFRSLLAEVPGGWKRSVCVGGVRRLTLTQVPC